MIDKIVQLQDEVNTLTCGSNWREKELLWSFAIQEEITELVDSLHLKWWKATDKANIINDSYKDVIYHTPLDGDNVVIETVDLLHFIISYLQVQYSNEEIVDMFIQHTADYKPDDVDNMDKADYKLSVFWAARLLNKDITVYNFIQMCKRIGIPLDILYRLYLGKNTLNKFRQDNGYKDGTYIKVWDGVEDNVIMQRYVLNGTTPENMYQQLTNFYTKKVKRG